MKHELTTHVSIDSRGIIEEDAAPGVTVDLNVVKTVKAGNVVLCRAGYAGVPDGITPVFIDVFGNLVREKVPAPQDPEEFERLIDQNERLASQVVELKDKVRKLTGQKLSAESKLAKLEKKLVPAD